MGGERRCSGLEVVGEVAGTCFWEEHARTHEIAATGVGVILS